MAFFLLPRWHGSVTIDDVPWVITSWSVRDGRPASDRRAWLIDLVNDDGDEQTIVIEKAGTPVDPSFPFDRRWSPSGPIATVTASGASWRVREWTFVADARGEHHTLEMDAPSEREQLARSVLLIRIPPADTRRDRPALI